jgi:hypothetical protein
MTDKPKRGRPPVGNERGSRINLYLTEPRAALFDKAFLMLKAKRRLPSTAEIETSRTEVIDYALDALIRELETED